MSPCLQVESHDAQSTSDQDADSISLTNSDSCTGLGSGCGRAGRGCRGGHHGASSCGGRNGNVVTGIAGSADVGSVAFLLSSKVIGVVLHANAFTGGAEFPRNGILIVCKSWGAVVGAAYAGVVQGGAVA